MTIYFYDGSHMTCSEIEFGFDSLIVDGCRIVEPIEVLRIVAN